MKKYLMKSHLMKKFLCLALVALMAVSAIACAPRMTAPPAQNGAGANQNKSAAEQKGDSAEQTEQKEDAAKQNSGEAGQNAANEPDGGTSMEIWMSVGISAEEHQSKPQEEWKISEMLRGFEAKHPGVKIELTVPVDQQVAHQTFKAAVLAGAAPDVANLWSGACLFSLRDVVLHLDKHLTDDDWKNIIEAAWTPLYDNFSGPLLGFPYGGIEVNLILVNKKLLKECGYDMDANPIETMEDLYAACEAAKGAGKIPILSTDNGANMLMTNVFGSQWINLSGLERIFSNSMGETKYAEDEGFLRTIALCADLYAKGYINEDYATAQAIDTMFYQEEGVMMGSGNWELGNAIKNMGEENVDFIMVPWPEPNPPHKIRGVGGVGQCLAIAMNSRNTDLALSFCAFALNRENSLIQSRSAPVIPFRSDISTKTDLGWNTPLYQKLEKAGANCGYYPDGAQSLEVMMEFFKQGTLVVTGEMTPEEFAARLDQKAAEAKAQR